VARRKAQTLAEIERWRIYLKRRETPGRVIQAPAAAGAARKCWSKAQKDDGLRSSENLRDATLMEIARSDIQHGTSQQKQGSTITKRTALPHYW
jgi:hypothetical protein